MYFAPWLGSFCFSLSDCSKHITFSLTFGPHVLQTTICVTFFARRRSFPWSVLGGRLASPPPEAAAISGTKPPRQELRRPGRPRGLKTRHNHVLEFNQCRPGATQDPTINLFCEPAVAHGCSCSESFGKLLGILRSWQVFIRTFKNSCEASKSHASS